jgi:pyruvate kinase
MGACLSKAEAVRPTGGSAPVPAAVKNPGPEATGTPGPVSVLKSPQSVSPSKPERVVSVQLPMSAGTPSHGVPSYAPPRRMSATSAASSGLGPTPSAIMAVDRDDPMVSTDWFPEYMPENVMPPNMSDKTTYSSRGTRTSKANLLQAQLTIRKTKIVCTMGPACWSEETLGRLIDAGMNIARFNFSHGDHKGHGEVLERFRKVAADKKSNVACLMDTKGPEIRTAMLRDHKPITLEANQDIIVEAVGDKYTEFAGYKTEEETRIGLSYAKLCESVLPGNRILIADGTVVIEVKEIVNETTLRGTVLNSKELGERKNCNLPGVVVDIPVLTPKDIDDVQNFCAKHKMDFIAASFVQSGEDVRFIRKTLDDAGGQDVKIICKIENEAGLANIDEIIRETDGIMVARGDLGMEIPSEKVSLAQKMIITKCNVAGKFVITATQMLESMVKNPLPTRAEMTDVANAVYDGTDAVMLSGETANGSFPAAAVSIMSAISSNAELGLDYYSQFLFIRRWNVVGYSKISCLESTLSCAAQSAIDFSEDLDGNGVIDADEGALVIVFSSSGRAANLISK